MATTKQIYEILNSINAQANTGATIVKSDATFISYGDTITNLTDEGKERLKQEHERHMLLIQDFQQYFKG